jgi:hypothetical protein
LAKKTRGSAFDLSNTIWSYPKDDRSAGTEELHNFDAQRTKGDLRVRIHLAAETAAAQLFLTRILDLKLRNGENGSEWQHVNNGASKNDTHRVAQLNRRAQRTQSCTNAVRTVRVRREIFADPNEVTCLDSAIR